MKTICNGIPQGSILGPLLFLVYVNDFPKASNVFNFFMYADDTTLFIYLFIQHFYSALFINKYALMRYTIILLFKEHKV